MPRVEELTNKERVFVENYVVDYNATNAARAAGYKDPNKQGYQILKRPLIQREIKKVTNKESKKLIIRRQMVVERLHNLLVRDVRDFFDDRGEALTPNELPKSAADIVDGFEQTVTVDPESGERTTRTKYRLSPILPAVDLAMKFKGMFPTEKIEHNHKVAVDWEQYYRGMGDAADPVKKRIAQVMSGHAEDEGEEITDAEYVKKSLVEEET